MLLAPCDPIDDSEGTIVAGRVGELKPVFDRRTLKHGEVFNPRTSLFGHDLLRALAPSALTAGEKALLQVLFGYTNRKLGRAWPSQARLSLDLSVSGRTVKRRVAGLSTKGFLRVERRARRGQRFGVNEYQWLWRDEYGSIAKPNLGSDQPDLAGRLGETSELRPETRFSNATNGELRNSNPEVTASSDSETNTGLSPGKVKLMSPGQGDTGGPQNIVITKQSESENERQQQKQFAYRVPNDENGRDSENTSPKSYDCVDRESGASSHLEREQNRGRHEVESTWTTEHFADLQLASNTRDTRSQEWEQIYERICSIRQFSSTRRSTFQDKIIPVMAQRNCSPEELLEFIDYWLGIFGRSSRGATMDAQNPVVFVMKLCDQIDERRTRR